MGTQFQKIQDLEVFPTAESDIRGSTSSVKGVNFVETTEEKVLYIDTNNFHDWAMSQRLPHKSICFTKSVNLKKNSRDRRLCGNMILRRSSTETSKRNSRESQEFSLFSSFEAKKQTKMFSLKNCFP